MRSFGKKESQREKARPGAYIPLRRKKSLKEVAMFTLEGLLIGTGILWVLNAVAVVPITGHLVRQKLLQPAYSGIDGETAANQPELASLAGRTYMMVDTIVLGTAGLLMGLFLGWFFLGFCGNLKGWPGLLAFMAMSFIGASVR
jgi:hypothetical protein